MSRVEVEPTIITIHGKGRLIGRAVKRVSNVLLVIKLGEIYCTDVNASVLGKNR